MKKVFGVVLCLCVMFSTMVFSVPAEDALQNIASLGTPIVSITAHQGGGSKDIGVIADGVAPAATAETSGGSNYFTNCAELAVYGIEASGEKGDD